MSALDDLFSQTEDMPIPGGCGRCAAYQTMTPDPVHEGIFHLKIVHDDWCPVVRAKKAGNN